MAHGGGNKLLTRSPLLNRHHMKVSNGINGICFESQPNQLQHVLPYAKLKLDQSILFSYIHPGHSIFLQCGDRGGFLKEQILIVFLLLPVIVCSMQFC
jgi:hypothetical protein